MPQSEPGCVLRLSQQPRYIVRTSFIVTSSATIPVTLLTHIDIVSSVTYTTIPITSDRPTSGIAMVTLVTVFRSLYLTVDTQCRVNIKYIELSIKYYILVIRTLSRDTVVLYNESIQDLY